MDLPTDSVRRFRFAALGIVMLTIVIRLPSLVHPKGIDSEAMYSVVANEIVDGGRPYADAVERKPPLLFWTYATIFKIAGEFNWEALHFVALVWTLCALAGLYAIGGELFDRITGLIAALFYCVFQPWWTWKTLSFDGEMLMNLPIIWAWAIAFRQSSSRLRPELFAAGAFLGGFPAQAARCDSSCPPRHLFLPPELPSLPQVDAKEFDYSGNYTDAGIFRGSRFRCDCPLEPRHPP
jgi:hypothetical protein